MDNFWSKVNKTETCWIWTGGKKGNGYGAFYVKRKSVLAHRYVLELMGINVPKNMVVCHTCDNPSCVRPDHLFIGTLRDNSNDMVKKNRQFSHHKYKTECIRGHEFTEENTRIYRGRRICRRCERERRS